ncbi:MAG: hypothetical protein LOD92_00490 [Bacillales bacterium]
MNKEHKVEEKQLIFSSPVKKSMKKGELYIELYHYSKNAENKGKPIKTIRNFDELIEFFESEDIDNL